MKKAEFLRIAAMLNASFKIAPLLYGSLGLEQRLGTDLRAEDIDILIPKRLLGEGWQRLTALMEECGYRLYDAHEHAFEKEGLSAAFAPIEDLAPFAGIDVAQIPVQREAGVRYLLLELEDYLRVYTASSVDGYRKNVKNKQDQRKIELIREAIEKARLG